MGYGKRIDTLCSLLTPSLSFADVGCDHGYCSQYVLENALAQKVIFSDVSKGSLAKAQALLCDWVEEGRAVGVLGDGFFGVPKDTEQVLIAGMGGHEIVSILSHKRFGFIPKRFVFQPMHDAEKLRRYLLENGAYIERDYTFEDGKYYDVIVGGKETGKATSPYSEAEYEFGRENLATMPSAFCNRLQRLITDLDKYKRAPNLQAESRLDLEARQQRLQGVLQGEIK